MYLISSVVVIILKEGAKLEKQSKYFVEDIIPDDVIMIKYIFIFESPHNTEVQKGIPVSGKTGESLLKKIKPGDKENRSFGELVKYRVKDTVILNVSNVPLQKVKGDKRSEECLQKYDKVRKTYKYAFRHRKKLQRNIGKIERDLLDSLSKRLKNVLDKNKDVKIIVCGDFAKVYFTHLKLKMETIFMPHPARRGWNDLNQEQKNILQELKSHYEMINITIKLS